MKRKMLFIFFSVILFVGLLGCDFFFRSTTTEEPQVTTNQTATAVTTTSTVTDVITTESELVTQLRHIYDLAVEADAFEGTYEEWLETVRGPAGLPGEDGREVILRADSGYIQWQYSGDSTWNNLISLADLTGVGIDDFYINTTGELIVVMTDSTEVNLGNIVSVYTVQFKDYNGYVLDVQVLQYGEDAIPPVSPIRSGYQFTSWSDSYSDVSENLEIYAQYEVMLFDLVLYDGETIFTTITDIPFGTTVDLPFPVFAGHYFSGWYTGETVNSVQFTEESIVTSDLDLYARWSLEGYTVTFLDYDGTVLATELISYGYSAIAPYVPDRYGYTFDGWDTDFSVVKSDLTITAEYSLYHYETTIEGIIYDVYPAGETTVIGFDSSDIKDHVSILATVEGSPVIGIANEAFKQSEIITVSIPETVRTIGNDAFKNCILLEAVTFSGTSQLQDIGYGAFSFTDKLNSIIIPASVTSIGGQSFYTSGIAHVIFDQGNMDLTLGDSAFANNPFLEEFVIPERVVEIGEYCFTSLNIHILFAEASSQPEGWKINWNAENIEVLWNYRGTVDDGTFVYALSNSLDAVVLKLSDSALGGDLIIPDSVNDCVVTAIAENAFANDEKILTLKIPNTITEIPKYAFAFSVNLITVTFEENSTLEFIAERAFEGSSIKFIVFPASLKIIGYAAFNMSTIVTAYYESGSQLELIDEYAFSECRSLIYFYIQDTVKIVENAAFGGCYSSTIFAEVSAIPNAWSTSWRSNLLPVVWGVLGFSTYDNLDYIKKSDSTISILGINLLNPVPSVVEIPNEIETLLVNQIGSYAFNGIDIIEYISLPSAIEYVGEYAFGTGAHLILTSEMAGPTVNWQETWNDNWNWGIDIYWDSSLYWIYLDENGGTDVEDLICISSVAITELPVPNNGDLILNSWKLPDETEFVMPYLNSTGDDVYLTAEWVSIYQTTIDGVIYEVDASLGTSAIGYTLDLQTDVEILDSVDGVPVVEIADGAFIAADMTSISIPDTVLSIGEDAFSQCLNLVTVTFDSGSQLESIGFKAFYYDDQLTDFIIPDNVTTIGGYAFSNCNSMEEILISSNVTVIDEYAFQSCNDLNVYVEYSEAPAGWAETWSSDGPTVYWNVQETGTYDHLKYMLLNDDSVTILGFYGDVTGASISIPDSIDGNVVSEIAIDAFAGETTAMDITIPVSIVFIGANAFSGSTISIYTDYYSYPLSWGEEVLWNPDLLPIVYATEIHNIYFDTLGGTVLNPISFEYGEVLDELPSAIKAGYVFGGWQYVGEAFVIPHTMEYHSDITLNAVWIDAYDFEVDGMLFNISGSGATLVSYSGVEMALSVPQTVDGWPVIAIGDSALYNNSTLIAVDLPSSIETIGNYAFSECINLTSLTIGSLSAITSIGDHAFDGCDNLAVIGLMPNLISIGEYAFNTCYSLEEFYIPETVTFIGYRGFRLCDVLTIFTPLLEAPTSWDLEWNSSDRPVVWGFIETLDDGTLLYARLSNDQLIVLGSSPSSMETDIIIPDSYNGYPVVGISGGAFYQDNTIVTVEIGANVAYIGDEAFREVGTLSTVTIGTGSALISIGDYSFYDCSALTTFNIASDNVVTSIGEAAFESCGTLAVFDRMYNLVSISYNAFYGCYGLATFYISETVTVIEGGAFSHSVFGSSSLVIQTPLASQPATWDSAWKADDVTVTWSYSD